MRFKNANQRKAVMAKLSFSQLKSRGVKLDYWKDSDRDGVPNIKDCKPLNPKQQGIIHDFIKKKNNYVKMKQKQLEKDQDKMLKEIDSEKTKLSKHLEVQRRINENKKLKQELSELKTANFYQTRTGKIVASGRTGARFLAVKGLKFIKKQVR